MITTDIKSLKVIPPHARPHPIGASMMTTDPYPLYYRPITKCGSTFCLNLLYYLQYGEVYTNPINIRRAKPPIPIATSVSNETITNSPYSFIIVRDPIKRFISLYFDKLYGDAKKINADGISVYFIKNGLINPDAGTNIGKHRDNCIRSIQWIKRNLNGETDRQNNYHWKPQRFKLNQFRAFKVNILMLEDLHFQLIKTLKSLVPNIEDAIDAVSVQNVSMKPVRYEDIMNDELHQLIASTYPGDMRLYNEVSSYWCRLKENHA
jgi:uncharacterized protein YqfB (UPF0267 family)